MMYYITSFWCIIVLFSCTGSAEQKVDETAEAVKEVAAAVNTVVENAIDSLPGAQPVDFSISYLMGQFDPPKHADFVPVDQQYTDGRPFYLRKEAYESFKKMWEAAKKDQVDLTIISATRNFYRQKSIWEAKWTGSRKIENGANASEKYPDPKTRALKILEYSSMPGTSRHHWGTDMDLNDLNNAYFEQGKGLKVYNWLVANAAQYGFCQPYSPKDASRPNGYNEEKWHWSYMPLAEQLTKMAETDLKDEMISGFKGAEIAKDIRVVENYVLGINAACRH